MYKGLSLTQWNQPISIMKQEKLFGQWRRQTDTNQSILFEGRGYTRTNSLLESNELGNGSPILDLSDGERTTTFL